MPPGTGSTKKPPMNRPRPLQRVLRDCYCRLQPSQIEDIGVFAIRNISSGSTSSRPSPNTPRLATSGLPTTSSMGFRRVYHDCCRRSSCPAREECLCRRSERMSSTSTRISTTRPGRTCGRRMATRSHAPDDTTRGRVDSGLSDVWRRGGSERCSSRKVMIERREAHACWHW